MRKPIVRTLKIVGKQLIDAVFLGRTLASKNALDQEESTAELIRKICSYRSRGNVFANQDIGELSILTKLVQEISPRIVVEIGTAKGGTLYLWSRLVGPGGTVISIDKPGEVGSVGRIGRIVYEGFGKERGVSVITLPEDSHGDRVHSRLKRILGDRKVDFLFIDGDHTYDGVKADFNSFRSYVRPDGIIAFHDIAVEPESPEIQVCRFWKELVATEPRTTSLVTKHGQTPGIGVVR